MNKVKDFKREEHDFGCILSLVDSTISPDYLNPTQEMVLREVWNGKTYAKIAEEHNYDSEYIKTVGCNLWQMLSNAFGEQVNKGNFVPLMRRKVNCISGNDSGLLKDNLSQFSVDKYKKIKNYNWNTAPSVDSFVGREKECELLKILSQDLDCRCIMISGMEGVGKTSLVTKLSKDIKEKYDYVFWNSLYNPPFVATLINSYLNTIDSESAKPLLNSVDNHLSLLISQLINLLKDNKILIVLDGLENALEINKTIVYKKEFEGYSQLIRSIISTNHQSLIICTTQVVPRNLKYYSANRVKLMEIDGLSNASIEKIINDSVYNLHTFGELFELYNSVNNNPHIINIINNNLDIFAEREGFKTLISELSRIEEVVNLLEKEIYYLLDTEKEILYWLSTCCYPIALEELFTYLELCNSKSKLFKILEVLEKRKVISYQKNKIYLMPIIKSYLRRKLIYQSL